MPKNERGKQPKTKIQRALGHQELTHIRFWWLFGEEEAGSVEFDGEMAMAVMVRGRPGKGRFTTEASVEGEEP
jgi:dsRNA-specific ribonuclease